MPFWLTLSGFSHISGLSIAGFEWLKIYWEKLFIALLMNRCYGIINKNLWCKEPLHLVKLYDKNVNTVSLLCDLNNFLINWDILKVR